MPTLLQINVTANWGSTGKIAEQIGLRAQAYAWNSYIAYGREANPSENKLIKVGGMCDVLEHYAENIALDNEGLASRIATKRFLKKIDEIKPDVVHLHNIHDHWLNYKLLFQYLIKKQIPVVWTQHDQWALTGRCAYIPDRCHKWKVECGNCKRKVFFTMDRSRRNYLLKRELLSSIPRLIIIPVSKWLANSFQESYLKDREIFVFHNGIDINVFSPKNTDIHTRYGIEKGKKIVLGVAAVWDARKGLNDFYNLAKKLPKEEYSIIIVGQLTKKVPNLDDSCQIVFIPQTQNSKELAEIYSAASVFVNPTYQDNYPTTNLEAISCGTPVVTYRTGGSPESVDEATGLVIEQGNIEDLYKAIITLTLGNYKEACRKKAINDFDKEKCFEKYIDLYQSLVKNNNSLHNK